MDYVITMNLKEVDVAVGRFDLNCGCIELDFRLKEFEIKDPPKENPTIHLDIFDNIDIQELKDKVICEYNRIIHQLECGIQPDLEFLLEEISLIDIYENEY